MARLARPIGHEDQGYRVEAMDLECDRPWVLYALPAEESYAWVREVEPLDDLRPSCWGETLGRGKDPLEDLFWRDLDEKASLN